MLLWLDEEVVAGTEFDDFEVLVDAVVGLLVVELEDFEELVEEGLLVVELEDFELVVLTLVLEIVLLAVIFEELELLLLLEDDALEVELLFVDEVVEVQAPTIEGTASVPEPIATTFVPQLAAWAMRMLKLSWS